MRIIIEAVVPNETDIYALKGSMEGSWNIKIKSIKPAKYKGEA